MYTLTLQPWSAQWWASVAVAGLIGIAAIVHLIWNKLPDSARAAIRPLIWKPTAIARAVADERERCAKIADREATEYQRQIDEHNKQRGQPEHGWMLHGQQSTAANIAALLRLPEAGG